MSDTFFHHWWTRWTRNRLCGVELTVFATFGWSGFWNYFGIITLSCWSLRRNAKKIWNACWWPFLGCQCLMFFFLSSDLWAPTLPCSKCQHPSCTRYIVPCACHPTSRSHSLYGDFWSHKLLKTHLPIVLNLSLVKQNANNQHQPKQGSTQCTWLFAERANSTKHFIGP